MEMNLLQNLSSRINPFRCILRTGASLIWYTIIQIYCIDLFILVVNSVSKKKSKLEMYQWIGACCLWLLSKVQFDTFLCIAYIDVFNVVLSCKHLLHYSTVTVVISV